MNVRLRKKRQAGEASNHLGRELAANPAMTKESHHRATDDRVPQALVSAPNQIPNSTGIFESILQKERGIAALVGRKDDAAFVLSQGREVVEMNDTASAFAANNSIVKLKLGYFSVELPYLQRWLEDMLSGADHPPNGEPAVRILRQANYLIQFAIFNIPISNDGLVLIQVPPLFLVIVRDLSQSGKNKILNNLAETFDLTAAEIRLCDELVKDRSLKQAADHFSISIGTVRQRVKAIFVKTRTHRQSELVSLLQRFL